MINGASKRSSRRWRLSDCREIPICFDKPGAIQHEDVAGINSIQSRNVGSVVSGRIQIVQRVAEHRLRCLAVYWESRGNDGAGGPFARSSVVGSTVGRTFLAIVRTSSSVSCISGSSRGIHSASCCPFCGPAFWMDSSSSSFCWRSPRATTSMIESR